MGLPITIIEDWPDDVVAIVSPKLAETIRRAMRNLREVAEREAER